MPDYRTGAHTVYDIKYHVVWVTKYRFAVLSGEIAVRARDIIRDICMQHDVRIVKGHVSRDHVHLFVSAPPRLSVSQIMQYIKGEDFGINMVVTRQEEGPVSRRWIKQSRNSWNYDS